MILLGCIALRYLAGPFFCSFQLIIIANDARNSCAYIFVHWTPFDDDWNLLKMLLKALHIISLKMNCIDGTYKKGTAKYTLFHAILKYRHWVEGGSCLIIHFLLGEKANYSELKGFNML